mgnify:CR=1 FL=1
MKKLLLILLCAPFVGLGQDFDFNDLKGINSLKQFKKFSFEKEFTRIREYTRSLTYAQRYNKETEAAVVWSYYYIDPSFENYQTLQFQLVKGSDGSSHPSFNRTLEQVKKSCTFYDFKEDGWGEDKIEFICYTCPGSKYPGKIGFSRGHDVDEIEIFTEEYIEMLKMLMNN